MTVKKRLNTILSEIKENDSNNDKENLISHYQDEINSMRDEINWRVKMAYTGSLIFLTAIIIPLGSFFQKDNELIDKIKSEPQTMTVVGIVVLLAISAWNGVQTANHIVEKRIELYTLELMKIIKNNAGHPYTSWLGFLYGNSFFPNNKIGTSVAKTLNASIGFFIYFLPNIVSLILLIFIYLNGDLTEVWTKILYIFSVFFVLISVGSTLMFFIYINKVNMMFTKFYKEEMHGYFLKTDQDLEKKRKQANPY